MFLVPPSFTKDKMEDTLILNAGQSSVIEVPFSGCPQPKVTWTYNGGNLPDKKRTKTETIRNMSALTLSKVIRKDAGNYTIALSNDHGKMEMTVKLIVRGIYKLDFCLEEYKYKFVDI